MSKYFTMYERQTIEIMLKDGHTPKEIAARLGRHFTTVYKEIKKGTVTLKNSDWTYRNEYCADAAQRITDERQHNKGRDLKIGHDHGLARHIEHLVGDLHYSPYAAACEIKKNGNFNTAVSKGTIYNYIDMGIFLNISNSDLYSKRHPRRKKHGQVVRMSYKNSRARGIEERPADVKNRDTFGHWEMDTVYSGQGKSTVCILALTERMGRQEHLFRMPDRTLASTVKALDRLEQVLGLEAFRERFKTITVDNGGEFFDASLIERSCIDPSRKRTELYYCHPYCSSERASNENANKLIRHWISKGEDISRYSEQDIQYIEDWINNLPRQLFGGLSSNEYMSLHTTA